jgi:hypothetical protein
MSLNRITVGWLLVVTVDFISALYPLSGINVSFVHCHCHSANF